MYLFCDENEKYNGRGKRGLKEPPVLVSGDQ